jgi:phosphopantetheinyl transferase
VRAPRGATHVRVGRPSSTAALTVAERRHVATFADPGRAAEFRVARSWVRMVLSDYLDADPLALRLATGRWGKPHLVGHELHYNLSHTGGLCALAVSDRPVGIDVEPATRDLRTALGRCGSPRERHRLRGRPIADVVTVWTVKEAYAKALGLGHRCTFAHLETDEPLDGGSWTVRNDPDLLVDVRYDVPGHVLAVAHASGSPVTALDLTQVVTS